MKVPFVVPKVTQNDIDEVVKVLKSGWITSAYSILMIGDECLYIFYIFIITSSFNIFY